jgi:hypothetical protein
MYICTFPGMRTLKFFCAAFVAITAVSPLLAQNAHTSGGSAQAGLQIRVIVAPVILPPRHDRDRDRERDDDRTVSYHLSSPEQQLSVTREVRTMLIRANDGSQEQQPVQLTTIVAQ